MYHAYKAGNVFDFDRVVLRYIQETISHWKSTRQLTLEKTIRKAIDLWLMMPLKSSPNLWADSRMFLSFSLSLLEISFYRVCCETYWFWAPNPRVSTANRRKFACKNRLYFCCLLLAANSANDLNSCISSQTSIRPRLHVTLSTLLPPSGNIPGDCLFDAITADWRTFWMIVFSSGLCEPSGASGDTTHYHKYISVVWRHRHRFELLLRS